jgi:enoyl-[acyl-carrier protein] reductase III
MIYPCFKDKVALITGGTRGIGRAVAGLLAESGANLALVFRRDRVAAQAAEEELTRLGIKAITIQADLAKEESIPEIIESVRSQFGRLDYLVSNAVFGVLKPIGEFTAKRFDASMNTNARAYLLLAQAAAEIMAPSAAEKPCDASEKRIVALTSLGSSKIIPGYAAIGASKASIETLTKYLAFELAPKGIGVNAVSGGLVATDSMKAFQDRPDWIEDSTKRTPLGRIGDAEDIAKVVVWLLSDQSGWITGQTIIADGGLSLA